MFEKIHICFLLLIAVAPACLSYSAVVDSLGTYAAYKFALTMLTLMCTLLEGDASRNEIFKRQADNEDQVNDRPVPPCIDILCLRGRDCRDGVPGPRGIPGHDGKTGQKGEIGMKGEQGPTGPMTGGVTYVRWGRTTCPDVEGTELLYKGRVAGSQHNANGGGANYQCVTEEPENFDFGPGVSDHVAYIYGSEYQTRYNNLPLSSRPLHDNDVPCAVCYVTTRVSVVMIPGKYTCPQNWTREYYGWLMAERSHQGHYRSTFECVDASPETIAGGGADHNGALFYHVEPRCGSLPCPPCEPQKEMTCVVCTR